jgi:receptor-type tyrosine-protein phosphatase N
METRTVTQFHFLTWDELCNPPSAKAVLDFRRYVTKLHLYLFAKER